MLGFLRRLFGRRDHGAGYRCDGCGEWTPRSKGKAFVEAKRVGVYLSCPDCAKLKLYAKEQAAKAKAKIENARVLIVDDDGKDNAKAGAEATELMEKMQQHAYGTEKPARDETMAKTFAQAYGAQTGRESCANPNKTNVAKSTP